MRRFAMAVALGALLLMGAQTAHAQDILGLSLRATSALPEGTPSGLADIESSGGAYVVSVDLSDAVDGLSLEDFDGAEGFVLWAVDMDGNRSNLGTLDEGFMLEGADVDGRVARLYVTAESDTGMANPTGDRLFQVTLRSVEEQEAEESEDDAAEESEAEDDDADEGEADAEEDEEDKADAKPSELPTTGNLMRDLLVLLAVAGALILGGARLRQVRV